MSTTTAVYPSSRPSSSASSASGAVTSRSLSRRRLYVCSVMSCTIRWSVPASHSPISVVEFLPLSTPSSTCLLEVVPSSCDLSSSGVSTPDIAASSVDNSEVALIPLVLVSVGRRVGCFDSRVFVRSLAWSLCWPDNCTWS